VVVSDGQRFIMLRATADLQASYGRAVTVTRDPKGRLLVRPLPTRTSAAEAIAACQGAHEQVSALLLPPCPWGFSQRRSPSFGPFARAWSR